MSNEVNNRGIEANALHNPDDRLNRRFSFSWILWGLLMPIATILMLWVFWLYDLI